MKLMTTTPCTQGPVLSHQPHTFARRALRSCGAQNERPCQRRAARAEPDSSSSRGGHAAAQAALLLTVLQSSPALAEELTDFSKGSFSPESYWVTLALFLLSLPGLWSQVKRAPKAKIVRKTFEVAGPARSDAIPLDRRAAQLLGHFKKYNYELTEQGEVIRFTGTYAANRGQAFALVFYVFCGLASTGLVLSIAAPFGGQSWYGLTLLSPLAGVYYWQRATREEQFSIKMVTADDEQTTDIVCEGDTEEVDRLRKELGLFEKGKVYVKGILEG